MCRETIIDKPIKLPVIEEIIELLTSCTNKKSKVQNLVGDPQFLHDSRRHTSMYIIFQIVIFKRFTHYAIYISII